MAKIKPLVAITPATAQIASVQQMEGVHSLGKLRKGGVSVTRQLPPLVPMEEDTSTSVIIGRHIRSFSGN